MVKRKAADDFYPRPPCGGRHRGLVLSIPGSRYFYPRPPCGGRPPHKWLFPNISRFLSTSPLRGTTVYGRFDLLPHAFLSTSPLRGTTPSRFPVPLPFCISIHVPLAGDDGGVPFQRHVDLHFYPRPPCGGRLHPQHAVGEIEIISIHVPLAGDDPLRLPLVQRF